MNVSDHVEVALPRRIAIQISSGIGFTSLKSKKPVATGFALRTDRNCNWYGASTTPLYFAVDPLSRKNRRVEVCQHKMIAQTVPALPQQSGTAYISFSAEIIPFTTESLIALIGNLVNQGIKHIYLMISTPGGNVMNGLNLYNFLSGLPIKLTTHNVGNVDSIGNAVFLAGSERFACPHSTFMFHGVGFDLPGPGRIEEKFLRERLDSILSDQHRIGAILEERTKLAKDQIEGLFREAQTKDAAFAVSCGVVNEIRNLQIPTGAPIYSLVFQRQGV